MIVILSTAVIVTAVLQWSGYNHILFDNKKEGLANKTDDDDENENSDDENSDDEDDDEHDKSSVKKGESPVVESEEDIVYTSVKDASITDQEKMIMAHENLLKKMNKYKPLLDTLSGLTKNIVAVKQMTKSEQKDSDDNTQEMKKELADVKTKSDK